MQIEKRQIGQVIRSEERDQNKQQIKCNIRRYRAIDQQVQTEKERQRESRKEQLVNRNKVLWADYVFLFLTHSFYDV